MLNQVQIEGTCLTGLGHASMFLYAMNYLVGYEAWTMEQLKGYRDPKENKYETISHGHPKIDVSRI